MLTTKFSINKEALIEEQADGYILTRVPQSNMEYYWLLHEQDILSSDEKTMIVECDAEQDITVLPKVDVKGQGSRRPTLQEAIRTLQDPTGTVAVKAQELYNDYYEYLENLDPEQKAERARIRDLKREEALSKLNSNQEQQINGSANRQAQNRNTSSRANAAQRANVTQPQSQTPAQQMAQQRRQIQHYSKQQFREILKGVRQRVDTSLYQNIRLSHQQMKELRLSLKAGLDVSKYNSPFISAKHMKEIRMGAKHGVKFDMDKLDHSLYNAEQMHEIRLGFQNKLDVKRYIDPSYSAAQMRELRLGMQVGLDTSVMEDIHLSVEQMQYLRHEMVLEHLSDILKRFFENIRNWISEHLQLGVEHIQASMNDRDMRTLEQLKEANIKEAIAEIKYTLVQSDLLPESVYQDATVDDRIRENIEDLMNYMDKPEPEVEAAVERVAEEMAQAVGAEMNIPRDNKVVHIKQAENDKTMDVEREAAIAQAIDEEVAEAYGMDVQDMDYVIEQDSFDMMQ